MARACFPMFPSFQHGKYCFQCQFLFSRSKLCLRYTTGNFNENPSMRLLAKLLRARASEHTSNFCEQFEQRPNFLSTFKLEGTIRCPFFNFTPDFSNPRILGTPVPITRTNFSSRGANWPPITRTCENSKPLNADVNYIHTFKQIGHLDNLRKSTRNISRIIKQSFLVTKRQQVITNYFRLI